MDDKKIKPLYETFTFRLLSSTLSKLKRHAEEEQISVNTLANRIFTNYIEWDMISSKAGWAVWEKHVLKELIEELDEESIIKIATRTADSTKNMRLLMTGSDDIEGFFLILRNRANRSGFTYQEHKTNGITKFVLQHNLGKKCSLFFKSHYEQILNDLGYTAEFDYTNNILIINLK